ncbi:MAG: 2-amino-4-hydroxy-6-hydroxymethyldihydropteridine diphosphokinase [Aquisalinus sp.]|nr:2-amino-4-hydroxy-6-hydroxymethyldihydropteridine diphosphokinase [Aquisalinus sp.]
MIIVGLGANLPWLGRKPIENIRLAIKSLSRLGPLHLQSNFYKSIAWPDPSDPPYVNAVVTLKDVDLAPHSFLQALHVIEAAFGRRRSEIERYAARSLDLDLIAYHDSIIRPDRTGGLILPHPALPDRSFVLMPMAEILPDWKHPVTGITCGEMIGNIDTQGTEILSNNIKHS